MPPEEPTITELEPDDDLDSLWNSALTVLQKVDFQPDRQDRALGVITTYPTTSMQWHEPWRQDVGTSYALLESSMHTVRRKATVRFIRDHVWKLDVQVDVYRLSRAETQITSASSVLHGFSGLLPTAEGGSRTLGAPEHWVHLGRDEALEGRLLDRILNEAVPTFEEDVEPTVTAGETP